MSSIDSQQRNGSNKYALVVGINQSTDMPRIPPPIEYAESNAGGIAYFLRRKVCNFAFPSGNLIGKGINAIDVLGAIDKLTEDKSENDLLLFYFVGHGYSVEIAGRVETYLVTSDFDSDRVINNPESYVSLSRIREKLSKPEMTASVICILDCCHAGAIIEPARSEQQHAQSLQTFIQALKAFVDDITNTTQVSPLPHRTWVALASTGPEANAYHTFMTQLIIDMLNGDIPGALDHQGNLTLPTLYNYLQHMRRPKGQDPIMHGRFGSYPWVLAYHPQENKVLRKPGDYPQPTQSPQSSLKQHCDMLSSPAVYLDLDIPQVQEFLQKDRVQIQQNYQADLREQDRMQALGLMQGEHPSYGALLCFGQKRFLSRDGIRSACLTRCIYWNDTTSLNIPPDENIENIEENLLYQFTKACVFLKQHLGIRGISPNEVTERLGIPFRVLEEAMANALVHREYVTESDHIVRAEGVQVEIFSDRVKITSPGGPPSKLDLKHPKSHPRNSQIMRIFYLAGLVETLGTGIPRMRDLMQKAGLPDPDITADQQTFTIILHGRQQESALPVQVSGNTLDLANSSSSHGSNAQPIEQESTIGGNAFVPSPSDTPQTPVPETITLPKGSIATLAPPTPSPNLGKEAKRLIWHNFPITTPRIRRPLLATLFVIYTLVAIGLGAIGDAYFRECLLIPASTTIKIASDFPTSGLDITSGVPLQNGVEMAIKKANEERLLSGYTLELIPYNDVGSGNRHDPQVGANNLKLAIANNLIAGAIGPYNSTVALKELPIVNHAPLALLSPDAAFSCLTKSDTDDPTCTETDNIVTQMHPTGQITFFRLVTTTDRQGKANADYFFQTKHYSKVLLLKDDSDLYSLGLARNFQSEWQNIGGLVSSIDLPQNKSSMKKYHDTLQAASSFAPDFIYFAGGFTDSSSDILQALSTIATLKRAPFAGGGAIMKESFLQNVANLHRDAPVYISMASEDPAHPGTPTGADFEANYIASGYQDYVPDAATAYDCTMMLIQAIKIALQKGVSTPYGTQDHAGAVTFRQAVLQELRHLSYTGATGKHSFDTNGDTTNHTISFYQADLSTPQPSWKWLEQINS